MRATGVELGQSIKRLENLLTLLQARGSAAATSGRTTFVFRPGGSPGGNVFTTWSTLYAALNLVQGSRWVDVDDSLAAAVVTSGTYAVDGVTFTSTGRIVSTLIFADGAHFTYSTIALQNVNFECEGATPVTTLTGSQALITMRNDSEIANSAGAGFVAVGAGAALGVFASGAIIDTGAFSLTDAGGLISLALFDSSSLSPNAISGGVGTLNVELDGSCMGFVSTTQSPAPAVVVFDPTPTFVFQPGGSAGGNVFTTWATLMAAAGLCRGTRFIYVNDMGGAAHITAGAWNIDGMVFYSHRGATAPVLHIDEGATFTCSRFILADGLVLQNDATATVPFVSSAGTNPVMRPQLLGASSMQSSGAVAMFQKSAGGSITLLNLGVSVVGDGTHPVITVDGGQTAQIASFSGSTVLAHAVAGAGTFSNVQDASSSVSGTQDAGATTFSFLDTPNFVQNAANTGTGTGTVSAATANIARKRSGKVDVQGLVTGTVTAATTTVTVTLLRDATPILALPAVTCVSTAGFAIPLFFTDTLPDAGNHTYTVQAVAAAGNITVGAGGNIVRANEL